MKVWFEFLSIRTGVQRSSWWLFAMLPLLLGCVEPEAEEADVASDAEQSALRVSEGGLSATSNAPQVPEFVGQGHAIFVSNSIVVYDGPNPATQGIIDPAEVNNVPDVSSWAPEPPTGKEILRLRAQQDPEAVFRFFVALKAVANEASFNPMSLRSLSDASRADEIVQRKKSIEAKHHRVTQQIERLGGTVLSRRWLVDGLVVEATGPVIEEILALGDVKDASISESELRNEVLAGYDGLDIRSMLDTTSFENAHFAADGGGRAGGNIRVGFVDLERIACQHVGWLDWANGPSRLLRTYLCSPYYCYSSSSYCTTEDTHATRVASIAVGSIEQEQDSSYPGFWTSEQKRRSGIASEADVYQYTLVNANACDLVTAIEGAVADGVDVFNMSVGFNIYGPFCEVWHNECGLNEAITAALNSGVLLVKSAGNQVYAGTCNVTYPAQQPPILAVSGVHVDNFNPPPIPYHETLKNGAGAAGRILVTALDFSQVEYPVVGLVAPQAHSYALYSYPPTSYHAPDGLHGTSYAAPVVSGMAAVLKQALKANGFNTDDDARTLMANVLLAGDGFFGYPYNYSYYKSYNKPSTSTGYGRVHGRFPNSPELGTSSGWANHSNMLLPGHTLEIGVNNGDPIDSNVLGLKWVVLTDWDTLLFPPRIELEVANTCPSGGGTPYVVARANSAIVLRHMLRLNSYQTAGSCLRLKIRAVSVPTQGVRIHSAYYYYSTDINGEH